MQVQVLSSVPNREYYLNQIKFGTSGHRGIIGKTFTNQHVSAIAQAIALHFKEKKNKKPKVLIGYDTRTGNSPTLDTASYTFTLLNELIKKKVQVDFCDSYSPTPVISWAVKTYDYDMGIILTASHNPPNYNGIKINDENGAPASIELTQKIETEANRIFHHIDPDEPVYSNDDVERVNFTSAFIDHLQTIIKEKFLLPFPNFSEEYIIDPKCGSAIDIWRALSSAGIGKIHWLNDQYSSDFNFNIPDPTSTSSIQTLSKLCKKNTCIAFANDPDADRHVIIDENGQYISPEKLTCIIIQYCHDEGIPVDSVATTFANSVLIKKICQKHSIRCIETNIGFKYFTPHLLVASNQNKLSFGVESSGGFSISNHTLDKCGFLPILLIIGIMKKKDKTLAELSASIDTVFSKFIFVEDAITIPSSANISLSERLSIKQHILDRLFSNVKIDNINYSDGLKIDFNNNDWVLCRPSGTEPLIRIYAESNTKESAQYYIDQLKGLLEDASVVK